MSHLNQMYRGHIIDVPANKNPKKDPTFGYIGRDTIRRLDDAEFTAEDRAWFARVSPKGLFVHVSNCEADTFAQEAFVAFNVDDTRTKGPQAIDVAPFTFESEEVSEGLDVECHFGTFPVEILDRPMVSFRKDDPIIIEPMIPRHHVPEKVTWEELLHRTVEFAWPRIKGALRFVVDFVRAAFVLSRGLFRQ